MRAGFIVRVRFISAAILVFALVLIGKLYIVQIVEGDNFSIRAEQQYVLPTQELYDRGSVFFKDKEERLVSAATVKSGYVLAINPQHIENTEEAYTALSEVIEIPRDLFFERAEKKDDPYEEIVHRLTLSEAERIRALEIPGVQLYKERWRYYPGDTLAAQAIGFVGWERDTQSGRYGIERYYNDILSRDSSDLYVNFFAEIFSNVSSLFKGGDAEGDIVTSIEPSIQLYLEQLLKGIAETWDSQLTGGIVIDPTTGNIYALGVYPTFNINEFGSVSDPGVFANPLVESVYEMGSIMKPITMSIGIDSGSVTPETHYTDYGYIDVDGYRISNFDGKGRGYVSMQEVLNQSLNTGAAFVAQKTGTGVFSEYLYRLGIDEETGIDLPNESPGLVDNLKSPRMVEYTTASFGQGIALSPISMTRMLSALANKGRPITPHVAERVNYTTGLSKEITFPDEEQVFSRETTETLTRMLVQVVDEALLGGTVKLPHYSIAAKTGTAQIAKEGERGYYDDRFLHSFFGYFPAYEPRFLIFLYNFEPVGARYASQTLTYPFMDMTQFLINYYEIPPDR